MGILICIWLKIEEHTTLLRAQSSFNGHITFLTCISVHRVRLQPHWPFVGDILVVVVYVFQFSSLTNYTQYDVSTEN